MAKYAIDSTTLTGIADAIREKTKTTASVKTSQMAEAILAIKGGGVELNVLTASTLPAAVMDGQIVVIADTTPETVYIDTDAPASPATGDVWVKLEAEATVKLELSEESPYLRGGLTAAAQWDGIAWVSRDGYLGVDGEWKKISLSIPAIGTPLNDFTWEQISAISESRRATDYFAVGDAKEIVINGTVVNTSFIKQRFWAYIIGIYHDPVHEGGYYITFALGKTDETNGKNVCFVDNHYEMSRPDGGTFCMNIYSSNNGGWISSPMRTDVLGSSSEPSDPKANTLLAALPADLRAVMKGTTKYSDNVGGKENAASAVTATTEYLFLLAEYEVFGARTYANSAEQNYQKQYAYYAAGNSKVKYKHSDNTTAVCWSLRSSDATNTFNFSRVDTNGRVSIRSSYISQGVAPAFCV